MLSFEIPVYTRTESNTGGSHFAKARRAKQQRSAAYLACCSYLRDKPVALPCQVRIVRIAPGRGLDPGDNLPSSVKHIRDGIADFLEVDDRHEDQVRYVYAQEKGDAGQYWVRVEFEPMPDVAQIDSQLCVVASSGE